MNYILHKYNDCRLLLDVFLYQYIQYGTIINIFLNIGPLLYSNWVHHIYIYNITLDLMLRFLLIHQLLLLLKFFQFIITNFLCFSLLDWIQQYFCINRHCYFLSFSFLVLNLNFIKHIRLYLS
jgi:hypothetical protein